MVRAILTETQEEKSTAQCQTTWQKNCVIVITGMLVTLGTASNPLRVPGHQRQLRSHEVPTSLEKIIKIKSTTDRCFKRYQL